MGKKLITAMMAGAALTVATPASASYVFGFSGDESWTLTINGMAFSSLDQGWISANGRHTTSNDNYIVSDDSEQYNNWAVFDLSNLSGAVTSATLSIDSETVNGNNLNFILYDTAATLAELDAQRSSGDAVGIALHADLGSGVSYGNRVYNASDSGTVQTITLNASALSAIQSAAGGNFSLGGTLVPGMAAVPEPGTWAMMILGFGLIGGVMRRTGKTRMRVSYS